MYEGLVWLVIAWRDALMLMIKEYGGEGRGELARCESVGCAATQEEATAYTMGEEEGSHTHTHTHIHTFIGDEERNGEGGD